MHTLNKTSSAVLLAGVVAAAPVTALADFVEIANDTLSWSDGEITSSAGTSWAGAGTSLEYTVYFNDFDDTWKYTYEWSASRKSLSHIIISLTEDGDLGAFDYDNLLGGTGGGKIGYYGGEQSKGNSNPGLDEEMYGIKFDTSDDDKDSYFEIISDRGPMWGDFYAKSGVEMLAVSNSVTPYSLLGKKARKRLAKLERKMGQGPAGKEKIQVFAHNAGFGEDNDIWFNPDGSLAYYIADQILVPDSFEGAVPPSAIVPVPAAAWLFGSGLIGLVGIARRRKPMVSQN